MRHIDDKHLALECLKLALNADPANSVRLATDFFAFVTGDGSTPRAAIDHALDKAGVV